jgi:hypothetical protein
MVFMVCLSQEFSVLKDQLLDVAQVVRTHATVSCQPDSRIKPELALALRSADMHMRWIIALIGIEMKSERSDPQHCRHKGNLSPGTDVATTFSPNDTAQ